MEINVYKKYDFSYDEKQFMKNFKEAIVEKGYKSLSLFYGLLQKFECSSYETARSYYNLRRVIPLKLFASICNYLNLNATKIMYPNSIFEYNYTNPLAIDAVAYKITYFAFLSVFDYKENIEQLFKTMNIEEYSESIKKDVYTVSLILSKYNYLLQRYYYAGLSNIELDDMIIFSVNNIVERESNNKFEFKEFLKWKKELKTTDFLDEFYKKYTLSFSDRKCSEILEENKNYLTKELFDLINNLLYKVEE